MNALALFRPRTRRWFADTFGQPTAVQEEGWPAIAAGGDVLVSAPTGTGKSLTAFLYALDRFSGEAFAEDPDWGASLPDGVRFLYISPLKALGNDIRANLERPLAGLGLAGRVRAAVRTGDTPPAERAHMAKHPPQILITTPESLYLLLTSQSGRDMLRTVETVVCDELHALLSTKRGTHLAVSLARLDALCGRRVQRIGLSATVRPLETAAAFLSGPARPAARVVAPKVEKALDVRVELPVPSFAQLPHRDVWSAIARRAWEASQAVRTTLVFVDGRAQAEKLARCMDIAAGQEQYARTHHGCVSREQRLEAEQQLRDGRLRALVCTSSMELGIDVGDVGLVVQVGAPAAVSSLLQRAGRAGHGPGQVSRMVIYPRSEAETLQCALTARAALAGEIEPARVPEMCLDVLAQHVVSMAAAGDTSEAELLSLFRETWPYRDLDLERLRGVLRMLIGEFEHQRDLPVRPRVLWDRESGSVRGDGYTRMLACSSGGTIPDRGWYAVTLPDGTRLGELDEEFVFEARLGDTFLLGAFAWRIVEVRRDTVIVEKASAEGAQSPFWRGDPMGRSPETGLSFGRMLRSLEEAAAAGRLGEALAVYPLSEDAAAAAASHLRRQLDATGCLATDETLVAEQCPDGTGSLLLMLHCPLGRRVNRGLAILLREEARRRSCPDIRIWEDDDGVLLAAMGADPDPAALLGAVCRLDASALLEAALPGEPMLLLAFRYAAARALMLGRRGGARQPLWVQRLRGAESYRAALEQPGHPLLWEARREVLRDWMDLPALETLLERLRSGRVRLWTCRTDAPSPMAAPLRRQLEAELMYEYSPMPAAAERFARDSAERALLVTPEDSAIASVGRQTVPEDRAHLERLLRMEGDIAEGDAAAIVPWLTELTAEGRALRVPPGLWIAPEEANLYEAALASSDPHNAGLQRVLRRAVRFRWPQSAASLAQRYVLPIELCEDALAALTENGAVIPVGQTYVHRDSWAAAQNATIRSRREEAVTSPPERFAALLMRNVPPAGGPADQLAAALEGLCGLEQSAARWEDALLPARVNGYRPAMLDTLLAGGAFLWRLHMADGKPMVTFLRPEDEGEQWTQPPEGMPLGAEERAVLTALEQGGAQFTQRVGARAGVAGVEEALLRLAELGLVRKDSFAPVRAILHRPAEKRRPTVRTPDTGRWERCRVPAEASIAQRVDQAFRRVPLLCRETAFGLPWGDALQELRRREYSALVRRGYFVRGLSGAQFLRAEEHARVSAFLASEDARACCLSAADPAQPWGQFLPHVPGREFALLPQTAVVCVGGLPCAVLERGGLVLRVFDRGEEAVLAFAEAWLAGRIFPEKRAVTVKEYPAEAAAWLERAGFVREMLDYVLERKPG